MENNKSRYEPAAFAATRAEEKVCSLIECRLLDGCMLTVEAVCPPVLYQYSFVQVGVVYNLALCIGFRGGVGFFL